MWSHTLGVRIPSVTQIEIRYFICLISMREANNNRKYKIAILRPGGNDTLLVEGIAAKEKRKILNDAFMRKFPNVEQVGFYEYYPRTKRARLEMAGGEFCGNALRSLAYLLLKGRVGKLYVNVSGTTRTLKAGVERSNFAYAEMPIIKNRNSVRKLSPQIFLVELEGIVHLITERPNKVNPKDLKERSKLLLEKAGLLSSTPAAGVMFVRKNGSTLSIDPVVWVRDIETLFYETACASGTTAVGLWKAKLQRKKNFSLKILQPSNQCIMVNVEMNKNSFEKAIIIGQITLLKSMEVIINE